MSHYYKLKQELKEIRANISTNNAKIKELRNLNKELSDRYNKKLLPPQKEEVDAVNYRTVIEIQGEKKNVESLTSSDIEQLVKDKEVYSHKDLLRVLKGDRERYYEAYRALSELNLD